MGLFGSFAGGGRKSKQASKEGKAVCTGSVCSCGPGAVCTPARLVCTLPTCLAARSAASLHLRPDWAEAPQSAARLGRGGTAYAKPYFILISSNRGFKSLIRRRVRELWSQLAAPIGLVTGRTCVLIAPRSARETLIYCWGVRT